MYVSIDNEHKFDYIYFPSQFFLHVPQSLALQLERHKDCIFVKLRLTIIFLIITKQKNYTLKNRNKRFHFQDIKKSNFQANAIFFLGTTVGSNQKYLTIKLYSLTQPLVATCSGKYKLIKNKIKFVDS